MATTTTSTTPTNASDAQFRAWGLSISTQLAAMGWVNTTDTGQINWATVTAALAVSTAQGYEIWRFNDVLQATAPIYIKVEYGSGPSAVANIGLWWTLGTGSNGAGTLTGTISTRFSTSSTAYAVNPLTSYWSGSTSRMQAALWVQGVGTSSNICQFFSIERTKDATGNDTNVGILFVYKLVAGNSYGQLFWNRTTGTPAINPETSWGCMSNSGSVAKNGSQVAVYPLFLNNAGPFVSPPLGVLTYINADIVAFGAITFTIYGASHVYMPFGSGALTGSGLMTRTSGTPAVLMQYE